MHCQGRHNLSHVTRAFFDFPPRAQYVIRWWEEKAGRLSPKSCAGSRSFVRIPVVVSSTRQIRIPSCPASVVPVLLIDTYPTEGKSILVCIPYGRQRKY